eukprot:15890035-Heterocapsa_arctica.AAC.1
MLEWQGKRFPRFLFGSGMDLPGLRRRGELEYNISLHKWSPITPDAGKGHKENREVLAQSGKVPADRIKGIKFDEQIILVDIRVRDTFNIFTRDCMT